MVCFSLGIEGIENSARRIASSVNTFTQAVQGALTTVAQIVAASVTNCGVLLLSVVLAVAGVSVVHSMERITDKSLSVYEVTLSPMPLVFGFAACITIAVYFQCLLGGSLHYVSQLTLSTQPLALDSPDSLDSLESGRQPLLREHAVDLAVQYLQAQTASEGSLYVLSYNPLDRENASEGSLSTHSTVVVHLEEAS